MGTEGQQRQNDWARQHNLRISNPAWWCPRPIRRKQCLVPYWIMRDIEGKQAVCLCHHPDVLAVRDHHRTWNHKEGRVLTVEPYGPSPRQIEALRTIMATLDLVVYETDDAPWVDGGTQVLVITKPEITPEMLKL
jgi:hypothetical protein